MDFHQVPLERFGFTAPTEPSPQIHWEEQNLRQRLWDIIKHRRDGKKDVSIKTMHQWSNYYDKHYGPPVPLKTLYYYWEKLMKVARETHDTTKHCLSDIVFKELEIKHKGTLKPTHIKTSYDDMTDEDFIEMKLRGESCYAKKF